MKIRKPDNLLIVTEKGEASGSEVVTANDCSCSIESMGESLKVLLTAKTTPVRYIRLRWLFRPEERRAEIVRVTGDTWERGYGDMEWRGIVPERCMPWVLAVSNGSDSNRNYNGRHTECFGVKTRAGALCFWQYDTEGVTLWADVRNGGHGVVLNGRTLTACEVLFGDYWNDSAFRSMHAFYGLLNDKVLVPTHKVYGSNNWYYAYGKSSHDEILSDTDLVSELCNGLANRPYMVIDSGWQPHATSGPWDHGNKNFPDMKALADCMKQRGVRPGIWIRYLADFGATRSDVKAEYYLDGREGVLDPSHPEVLALIKRDTHRIVNEWGFQLIKHDFSTYDIFGDWGFSRKDTLTNDGWHFFDRTKTSAEIIIDFYRAIREAAGSDTVLIGCNVIGHLAAGLVELNRIGDDVSGRNWERTRKYGVNTVAFHMTHDKTFYAADADCVGIMGAYPMRPFNSEWLRLLSESGAPLFVSCKPGILKEEELDLLRTAFARASQQSDILEPIDWMENTCPTRWLINGKEETFHWLPEGGADIFDK